MLTVLWMAVIFIFSSQPADESAYISGTLSAFLRGLFESFYRGNPPEFINFLIVNSEHFIRKTGHIAEYLVLGMLVISLVKRLGVKRIILISLLICSLYAVSDELHQIFVPGRGPSATDVLLDSLAALAGILLIRTAVFRKNLREKS